MTDPTPPTPLTGALPYGQRAPLPAVLPRDAVTVAAAFERLTLTLRQVGQSIETLTRTLAQATEAIDQLAVASQRAQTPPSGRRDQDGDDDASPPRAS